METSVTVREAIDARLFSAQAYKHHRAEVASVRAFSYRAHEELLEGLIRYSQALDTLRDAVNIKKTSLNDFWPFYRNELISNQLEDWQQDNYNDISTQMLDTKWKGELKRRRRWRRLSAAELAAIVQTELSG